MPGHMKETAADIETKQRLWGATVREINRFADRYAEEFVQGERTSDGQNAVADAAKKKGYPKGIIRTLGNLARRDLSESPEYKAQLTDYQEKIGLAVH